MFFAYFSARQAEKAHRSALDTVEYDDDMRIRMVFPGLAVWLTADRQYAVVVTSVSMSCKAVGEMVDDAICLGPVSADICNLPNSVVPTWPLAVPASLSRALLQDALTDEQKDAAQRLGEFLADEAKGNHPSAVCVR